MSDLFEFFLKLPGGMIFLFFAFAAAAFAARTLVAKRPHWSRWQVILSASLPVPLFASLLTILAVVMSRHEDGLVPLVLLGLGIAAISLSFGVSLLSATIFSLISRS